MVMKNCLCVFKFEEIKFGDTCKPVFCCIVLATFCHVISGYFIWLKSFHHQRFFGVFSQKGKAQALSASPCKLKLLAKDDICSH